MQIKLKPWTGNERLYFYRQSQQLSGQTGQIGKLRADFDRDGNGFFSTWEDIRSNLKTEDFKSEFDNVINTLRFVEDGTPLANRKSLSAFLSRQDGSLLPNDGDWHGYRVDTDNYSYFFRLKPQAGDYNVYDTVKEVEFTLEDGREVEVTLKGKDKKFYVANWQLKGVKDNGIWNYAIGVRGIPEQDLLELVKMVE